MARSCSCNDFNRAALLRRGAAVAGKGLPNIEPGMPVPAGTGLDRRTFLLASAGAALSVYGASMLSPRHFEEGIAEASAASGPEPAGARLDLHGRRLGRAVGARAGQGSQVQRTASRAGARRRDRQALHRGRKPDVASIRDRPRRTARRRQGHGLPGDRLRAAGREPLHQPPLLGGRPARHEHAHRLDGALPRPAGVGEPNNPLQGLSLDYSLAPALATETMPVAAVSSPADYTMWAEGLGSPVIEPALETFGALGALSAPSPAYAQARGASYDTDLVLNKMADFVESEKNLGRQIGGHLPRRANSPNGSRCWRRCSTRECRSNAPL